MWRGASSDHKAFLLAALLLALTVGGCAGAGSVANNSPTYREGFGDGCATASAQTTPGGARAVRDAALYGSDQDYRAGWTSGFASCRMSPPQM
jgi:hypothetical protein